MVIKKIKIDSGQNSMHTIMSLSKQTIWVSREAVIELKCTRAVYRSGSRDRLQKKNVKTLLGHVGIVSEKPKVKWS